MTLKIFLAIYLVPLTRIVYQFFSFTELLTVAFLAIIYIVVDSIFLWSLNFRNQDRNLANLYFRNHFSLSLILIHIRSFTLSLSLSCTHTHLVHKIPLRFSYLYLDLLSSLSITNFPHPFNFLSLQIYFPYANEVDTQRPGQWLQSYWLSSRTKPNRI